MSNWYISSVGYAAIAQWAASTAYTVGQYVRQLATPTVGNERVFKCTTAGTSGATEPTWSLNGAATTTSGTAVFTECTGVESEQAAGNWKAPAKNSASIFSRGGSGSTTLGHNDVLYFASDHDESYSAAQTINSTFPWNGIRAFSVSRTGPTLPPTAADYAAGAKIETTGANALTIGGANTSLYWRGITFSAGSGANNATLIIGSSGASAAIANWFEDCTFVLNNTGASSVIQLGNSGSINGGFAGLRLVNPTFTFGAAGQAFTFPSNADVEIINSTINGTTPTNLFGNGAGTGGGILHWRASDLSGVAGSLTNAMFTSAQAAKLFVDDCKVNPAASFVTASLLTTARTCMARFDNCDDGTKNYRFFWYLPGCSVQSEAAAVRTGGNTDGVTPFSWKILGAGGANSISPHQPAALPPILADVTSTGSLVTATIEFIANAAAALTNADLFMEIEALTSAASPLASVISNRVADVFPTTAATAHPTSTAAWDGAATVRANSHAYTTGDIVKLASNPGRLFFCTSGGTSAASEPGGYASAVDGGSVTDGGATFRAGFRQKMQVSFTPQMKGFVQAFVKLGWAATTAIYLDPQLTIG